MKWWRRHRDERGAMALMIALMALVLFVCGALAVDLGNMWARKRDVQKQADVTALSAGYLLPATTANKAQIADEVATYLNENDTVGQDDLVTGAMLLNGNAADGEVTFQDDDGNPCATGCTRMTVKTPLADVDFGLANLIGASGSAVQRDATVRVVSALPSKFDMLPFWLPTGCALGPAQADTQGGTDGGSGGGSESSPTPTPTPTSTSSASPSPSLAPGVHTLSGPAYTVAPNSTTTVSSYTISNIPSNIDRASIRFYSPDGSRYVDYAAMDVGKTNPIVVPSFQVGAEVSATPGDWRVFALVQKNNGSPTISANSIVFTVSGAAPTPTPTPTPTSTDEPTPTPTPEPSGIPVGCIGQDRGNFGQLDSPRVDMSGSTNKRLALNVAEGLDHQLVPFVFAPSEPVTKDCGSDSRGFITGAQPDNVSQDGRNCITGDTGNDGSAIYDGLIGGNGVIGRLSRSRPDTATSAKCATRSDATVGGTAINNDVLSCFLRNGATLDDIAQTTGVTEAMMDPEVVDSPRFVWLPVVYATDREQKDFQPIYDFVPAFITDETQTTSATADNGVVASGNKVSVLQIFCFSKDALPVDAQSPTISYIGGLLRSIVRLVE